MTTHRSSLDNTIRNAIYEEVRREREEERQYFEDLRRAESERELERLREESGYYLDPGDWH